jgi:hypothetical protein
MLRLLYAIAVVTLIGGSAVTAAGIDRDSRAERGVAIALMASLPR